MELAWKVCSWTLKLPIQEGVYPIILGCTSPCLSWSLVWVQVQPQTHPTPWTLKMSLKDGWLPQHGDLSFVWLEAPGPNWRFTLRGRKEVLSRIKALNEEIRESAEHRRNLQRGALFCLTPTSGGSRYFFEGGGGGGGGGGGVGGGGWFGGWGGGWTPLTQTSWSLLLPL